MESLQEYRKGLHVSYSQIKTYMICPEKYQHHYILGAEPSHRPVNMVLGSVVHHALAAYYLHVKETKEKIELEKLLDLLSDKWVDELDRPIPIRFDKKEEGEILDQAISLLSAFYEKADLPHVEAVEMPFSVALVDPGTQSDLDIRMIGAFDLVTNGTGNALITEHKTSSRKYSQTQLDYEIQPAVYAYAAMEMGLVNPKLRYQILVKTKKPAIEICNIDRSEKEINEMLETVCAILKAIEADIFFKQRGWACADCQYKYKCDQ